MELLLTAVCILFSIFIGIYILTRELDACIVGERDYKNGLEVWENPYDEYSIEWDEWRIGYFNARDRALK